MKGLSKKTTILEEYDFFSTKGELTEFLLLKKLSETNEPVGSWVLKTMLEVNGLEVSTATVGRILKTLDAKKYSKLVENQGRLLTAKGQTYISHLSDEVERMRLQQNLMEASKPGDFGELLDLIIARKTIECETVRLAALRATVDHIEDLYHSLEDHDHDVSCKKDPNPVACIFHEKIAEASQNRFLIATLNILIYEELKLESKISDLITREKGAEYVQHHRLIADAIRDRNADLAVRYMQEHMDAMLSAIEEQSGVVSYGSKKQT
ncbi:FCD domain-containing protein [Anaerobacillus alkaliphilus]|uniref:FCD domain-containing protein n=1 Tax=Anaerobacillus alkaliphilus TaxID=1548597 RepID=A0A4Q0VTJ0_9BACI|nr:FCD domain-containing protein [Anaerobacillus alkaliphilus]RXJ01320.1 FCD domain-containing protein [Anaerobacillus alkaliphilus]